MTCEEKVEKIQTEVGRLKNHIKRMEESCCSTTHIEQRMKTNILLVQLGEKFEKLEVARDRELSELKLDYSNQIKEITRELGKWRTYQNYLLGGISVIYFLGIDDRIKVLLGG